MRALFILMVLYIHSNAVPVLKDSPAIPDSLLLFKQIWGEGFTAVAVPGFFLISSFLLFSKPFSLKDILSKKTRTILIPFVIINSFWIVFFSIMQHISSVSPYFADYKINGISGVIGAFFSHYPLYYPFWFIRDLFIMCMLAPVIRMIILKSRWAGLIFTIILAFVPLQIYFVEKRSIVYFVLGGYAACYGTGLRRVLEAVPLRKVPVLIPILAILLLSVAAGLKAEVFGVRILMIYVLLMFLCWYFIVDSMPERIGNKISKLGKYTFFIYAFHEYYMAMLKKALMIVLPKTPVSLWLQYIFIPVIMFILLICIARVLERYCPKLYGFLCGKDYGHFPAKVQK